jgi:hypothetical protein
MKYALPVLKLGLPCVLVCSGETPFPEGSAWPVSLDLPGDEMMIENGILREKTLEEKEAFVQAENADQVRRQAEAQAAKSLAVKLAENEFLTFCDTLSGGSSHSPLTRDQLQDLILAIEEFEARATTALVLLNLDAKLKTLTGKNDWALNCAWHEDVI